jgi:hypothetical protein
MATAPGYASDVAFEQGLRRPSALAVAQNGTKIQAARQCMDPAGGLKCFTPKSGCD